MSAHDLAVAPVARGMTATPRILVVEDDPSVRGLLRTLLSAEGYDVDDAADGLAALLRASQQPPSLILLDVVMPDLGGIRVLETMRADAKLADVPVIVVTGKTEILPGLADMLGEDNVFAKPFTVEALLQRVSDVTGGPPRPGGPTIIMPR
jgi:DNA-binding response OmpR family regulator